MTNWYPYRWVCQKCEAVHWYAPEKCQNDPLPQLKAYNEFVEEDHKLGGHDGS